MAWILLVLAGALEVLWAFTMKKSEGFSQLTPTLITVVAMLASVGLLALAMRSLPLGTAYAVWTGIGAFGAFLVGILVLGEEISVLRVGSAGLILLGVIGLKLASGE